VQTRPTRPKVVPTSRSDGSSRARRMRAGGLGAGGDHDRAATGGRDLVQPGRVVEAAQDQQPAGLAAEPLPDRGQAPAEIRIAPRRQVENTGELAEGGQAPVPAWLARSLRSSPKSCARRRR
jgi:hypothetical protein